MEQFTASSTTLWSDLTSDKICSELEKLSRKIKHPQQRPGIIIAAGKKAYSAIRQIFPEDTEDIKVVNCRYCENDQCFIVKNMIFS